METTTNELNSCLMLAVNLVTPVDLAYVFDAPDLYDTGIELDSHITLLYAQSKELPKNQILTSLHDILGEDGWEELCELYLKNTTLYKALDIFTLGSFENDSDYVVLKLKPEFDLWNRVGLINKGLRVEYRVSSDYDTYTPHVSLAELKPGMASKYLTSEKLLTVLDDSYVNFEDIILSYGKSNEPEDRKQYYLTSYKCIDRYFRLQELKKNNKEILG